MKKNLLFLSFSLLFLVTSGLVSGQPCTPNNDTISGIEPDTLSVVYVGIPYDQAIYFRLPEDTIVDFIIGTDTIQLHVCLDSLTIDSVKGLPDGFTINCNVPWCSVPGGGNGCASITGTATDDQVGIHPIEVFVSIYANDCYSFPLPVTVDTVSFYFLDIQFAVGMGNPIVQNSSLIKNLYPNPANDQISFEVYNSFDSVVDISINDLTGKELIRKQVELRKGLNSLKMDVASLSQGVYLLSVGESQGVMKFQVER